jgi:hypothetical protein
MIYHHASPISDRRTPQLFAFDSVKLKSWNRILQCVWRVCHGDSGSKNQFKNLDKNPEIHIALQ